MTERELKEQQLVEELAALGKIYTDSRAALLARHNDLGYRTDVADALANTYRYAADKMIQLLRNYAADSEEDSNAND